MRIDGSMPMKKLSQAILLHNIFEQWKLLGFTFL